MSKNGGRSFHPVTTTGRVRQRISEEKKQVKKAKECTFNSRCGSFQITFSDMVNICGLSAFLSDDAFNITGNLSDDAKGRIEGFSFTAQLLIQLLPVLFPFIFLIVRSLFCDSKVIDEDSVAMSELAQIANYAENEPLLGDLFKDPDDLEDAEDPGLELRRQAAAAAVRATNAFHKKVNLMPLYTGLNAAFLGMCFGEACLLIAEHKGALSDTTKKSITNVSDNIYEAFNIIYGGGTFLMGFWMSRKLLKKPSQLPAAQPSSTAVALYSQSSARARDQAVREYQPPALVQPLLGSGPIN